MSKDFIVESAFDAFLALSQIDDEEVADMVRPRKKMTEGRSYSVNASANDLEAARSFLNDHKQETELEVIDADADSIEHIKNKEDYVGQAILKCNRCERTRFMDLGKLVGDENDNDLYNVEDECPYCKTSGDGYALVGQVGKVEASKPVEEAPEAEEPAPEETTEVAEPVAVDNDEATEEIAFDNDFVETELDKNEEAETDKPADEEEEVDAEFELPEYDEEENKEEEVDVDEDLETSAHEDEDDLIEDVELDDDAEEDESVNNMFGQDMVKEAYKESEFGKKAWMLGQIMQCMNDEEAYYGGWLYIWPDGETEEDCMYDFADEEDYAELEESFIKYYTRYHNGGLYNAPEDVEKAAHEWDIKLGLAPIENIKDIHEDVEDEEEELDEAEPIVVKDLLDSILEPENCDEIVVIDNGDVVFEGVLEDMPEDLFNREFASFNVGESNLNICVDSAEETDDLVADFLDVFDDTETDQIIVTEMGTSEALGEGTKDEVIDKFGDLTFLAIEAPEHLVITLKSAEEVDANETEEEAADENNNGPFTTDESLFEQICKANNLATYRIDKIGSSEYWINEVLTGDKDEFDLRTIYETFVRGYGEELEYRFKKETGYRETLTETLKEPEVKEIVDEEYNKKQLAEFIRLCKQYGVNSIKDLERLCSELAISDPLTAIRKYSRKVGQDFELDEAINVATDDVQVNENKPETCVSCKSFKTRQELGEAISECKKNNRPFRIERSKQEGYRYDLITEEVQPVNEVAPLITAAVTAAASGAGSTIADRVMDKVLGEDAEESTELARVDNDDAIEGEVLPAEEASTETAVTPAEMSDEEVAIMQKIGRIARDISDAIKKYYNIDANPALIVADIMQDLKLIGGAVNIDDLEDTPINRATKSMFMNYQATYDLVDAIMTELTGEEFHTTSEQKLGQALQMLDTPSFYPETIDKGIGSTRFLQAARAGQIPFITQRDLPMLECVDESMLTEAKKDEEELPADPAAVKTDVHRAMAELVADEVEAIEQYDAAINDVSDVKIEHKDDIIDELEHIKEEEQEHIDELTSLAGSIPFEKTNDEEVEKEEEVPEEIEEPENNNEPFSEEEVDFNTDEFEEALNEHFNNIYDEAIMYHTESGYITEKGRIVLEGVLESANFSKPVTFTLYPKQTLSEELKTAEDVAKAVKNVDFVVENDLSDEKFEYTFSGDRETPDIAFADNKTAQEIVNEFDKEFKEAATYECINDKYESVANWEYVRNMEFYLEHGYTEPIIKNRLMTSIQMDEGLETKRTLTEFFWPGMRGWIALTNWAEQNDLDVNDLAKEDIPTIANEIFKSEEEWANIGNNLEDVIHELTLAFDVYSKDNNATEA